MLVAATFMTAKEWKLPRCPSTSEWINKKWCLRTMEYYLATKRNGVLIHATARKEVAQLYITGSCKPWRHIHTMQHIQQQKWTCNSHSQQQHAITKKITEHLLLLGPISGTVDMLVKQNKTQQNLPSWGFHSARNDTGKHDKCHTVF